MAFPKLAIPSTSRDDNSSPVYSGELIKSLIEIVEKTEEKYPTPADDDESVEPENASAPLTIDEVLKRSGVIESPNPYLRLLSRLIPCSEARA